MLLLAYAMLLLAYPPPTTLPYHAINLTYPPTILSLSYYDFSMLLPYPPTTLLYPILLLTTLSYPATSTSLAYAPTTLRYPATFFGATDIQLCSYYPMLCSY